MATLSVYDPAMCCSTGVCGPSVDSELARFSADLDWLRGQGVEVSRYNLSQQPGAFVSNEIVRATLNEKGETVLPVLMVDGEVKATGAYPSREQLAGWLGVSVTAAAPSSGGCCGGGKSSCC